MNSNQLSKRDKNRKKMVAVPIYSVYSYCKKSLDESEKGGSNNNLGWGRKKIIKYCLPTVGKCFQNSVRGKERDEKVIWSYNF